MSVQTSEVLLYRSLTVNDTASNGGRLSAVVISDGETNGIWPDVPQSERVAGSTKYRKLFWKFASASNDTAYNVRLALLRPTDADDRVQLFTATHDAVQSSITGSENLFGCGKLNATVSSGVTQVVVLVENGATVIFRNTQLIRISDKATIDGSGNEEFVTVSGTPSVNGNLVTINFTPALTSGYSNSNTYISGLIEAGDIVGSLSSKVVTSAAGTFDETKPIVPSIGGIRQAWTITFSNATNFSVAGDTVGSVGSGNISSPFAPTNASFGLPYFTIPTNTWGGTFAANDTVTFATTPAAVPFWCRRVVPAGAGSLSLDTIKLGVWYE